VVMLLMLVVMRRWLSRGGGSGRSLLQRRRECIRGGGQCVGHLRSGSGSMMQGMMITTRSTSSTSGTSTRDGSGGTVVGVTVVLLHAGHAAPGRPLHVVGHLRQALEGLLAPDAGEDVPGLLAGAVDPLRLPGILPPTAGLGAHRLRSGRRRLL